MILPSSSTICLISEWLKSESSSIWFPLPAFSSNWFTWVQPRPQIDSILFDTFSERNYDFEIEYYPYVDGKEVYVINISPSINSVHPIEIGKAIEAIIRVIYNDLSEEAGLYFVTELKQYVGEQTTDGIIDCDVDLDQIQLEQHYAYRRQKRKKAILKAGPSKFTSIQINVWSLHVATSDIVGAAAGKIWIIPTS